MSPKKPKVFIASSGLSSKMVKALNRVLSSEGISCQEWQSDGTWGGFTFTDLLQAANECQYAICVMWPDDELANPKQGKTHVTRDNVVFEAGLFAGVLNPMLWKQIVKDEKRVFAWVNNKHAALHLPSDLKGLHESRYDYDGDLSSARIDDVVNEIQPAARVLADQINTHWATFHHRNNAFELSILNCFQRDWTIPPPRPPRLPYNPKQVLLDLDDVYDSFVSSGASAQDGIVIVDRNTRWVWDLFPILLHWRLEGYSVNVVAPPPAQHKTSEENHRRELLIGLGCSFYEREIKERLFILNPDASSDTIAFQFENERHYIASRRTRSADTASIEEIDKQLLGYGISTIPGKVPAIRAADEREVIDKLTARRGPPPYRDPNVKMRMDSVPLSKAFSISVLSRSYRFRQAALTASILNRHNLPLFEPSAVILDGGKESLITPPVVEKRNGEYIFIEGNTRALHSLCNGLDSMKCLVVEGVTTDLPAKPIPLEQVLICRLKLPAAWRQIDWNYATFRNIEAAIHNH